MNEIQTQEKDHFSVQQLQDILGQNMLLVQGVAKEVGNLSKRVDSMGDNINNIQRDIVDIKENEEITFTQQQNIQMAVHSKVYQLLGVPVKKSDRTTQDAVVVAKYSQLFHNRCYREVMSKGHLQQPYRTTPKKFYDDAIADIEAWYPRVGVQGLKDEADKDALAKRIAQEQGY